MAIWLVEHGITSISANIDAIAKIREAVAKTEKRIILEAARTAILSRGLTEADLFSFLSSRKREKSITGIS